MFQRRVLWPVALTCVLGGVAPCSANANADANGVVKGKVRDGSGAAVAGASVALAEEDAPAGTSVGEQAVTGANGEFVVKGLPAGWFTVVVRAKGFSDVALRRARVVTGGFVDLLVQMRAGNAEPPVTLDALSHAVAMTPLDDTWEALEGRCQGAATDPCLELGGIHLAAHRDRLAFGAYATACDRRDGLGCLALAEHGQSFGLSSTSIATYRTRSHPLLERACARGDAPRCAALAAETRDDTRARGLWTKACDGGSAAGCAGLADATKDSARKATLMKRVQKLAEDGCVANRARDCFLAATSRAGDDISDDDRRNAALYLRKACALGQLEACVP